MLTTFLLYNFILFGSTLCIYVSEKCPRKTDKTIMRFTAFLIITIPAALRFNIGYDYPSYVQIFEKHSNGISSAIEPFWLWVLDALNFFNVSSSSFFIVSSILIYGILILSYPKKYGYIINYMYITLFYFQSFSVIRSALALSLLLYAIFFFINTKKTWSFIIMIIATGLLIHKSAYIFLLVPIFYLIYKYIKKASNKLITIVAIILLFIFSLDMINYIISSPFSTWLGYSVYAKLAVFTRPAEINSGAGVLLKLSILLLILAVPYSQIKSKNLILYLLGIFSIVTYILSLKMFIFSRLHLLFIMGYFFIPYLLLLSTNKYKNLFVLYIMCSSLLLFEHSIFTQTTNNCMNLRVSPYVSIYNKTNDQGIPWSICEERKWKGIYD